MNKPLFAALLCVLFFATPSHAGQSARAFLAEQGAVPVKAVAKSQARHPAYEGRSAAKSEGWGGGNALKIAKRYLGTNPTKMRRLWCAALIGLVERKAGRPGTGSNLAKSYARYGKAVPLSRVQPGDIVVLTRKGGGHVGYALGPASGGKIKLLSGNTGGRKGRRIVAEGYYPTSRVIAVRRPG